MSAVADRTRPGFRDLALPFSMCSYERAGWLGSLVPELGN